MDADDKKQLPRLSVQGWRRKEMYSELSVVVLSRLGAVLPSR
jgi:hypothetical protein